MKIIVASNNEHKIAEFKAYFANLPVEIHSLNDESIDVNPDETGKTFKENAFIKAQAISQFSNDIIVSDDSGLEIHALDNFPGIYSSRFLEGRPYQEKFIEINKMMKGKLDRSANFNCTLCVMNLEKEPIYFEGKTEGVILESALGKEGFGYDPIFFYPPFNKTFAELTQEEKNQVSHRGNALKKFINYLKEKKYL